MDAATRGAAKARVTDVQRVLDRIPREDRAARPSAAGRGAGAPRVGAVAARRRAAAAPDARSVGHPACPCIETISASSASQLLQLVKSQPALEAIRRLDGPRRSAARPARAAERRRRAAVGMRPPGDLRAAHSMLVGAWRFRRERREGPLRRGPGGQRRHGVGSVVRRGGCADDAVARPAGDPRRCWSRRDCGDHAAHDPARAGRRSPDVPPGRRRRSPASGTPLDARDRLVVVPTRAAAAYLLRSIENRSRWRHGAARLPDLITPGELVARLADASAAGARVR